MVGTGDYWVVTHKISRPENRTACLYVQSKMGRAGFTGFSETLCESNGRYSSSAGSPKQQMRPSQRKPPDNPPDRGCGQGCRRTQYRMLSPVLILLGSNTSIDLVWSIQDCARGLLILPNIAALLLMAPKVRALTREFFDPANGYLNAETTTTNKGVS